MGADGGAITYSEAWQRWIFAAALSGPYGASIGNEQTRRSPTLSAIWRASDTRQRTATMAMTVFAEGMGLFHKGSNGTGTAPGDVCLTPPPPPAGPIPVPYVNNLSASDLTKGSKSVKIDGEETALEDHSEIATSVGNEPATQGGNVVTHKTKGKGNFSLWSFTVKIEGKGVGRHGDMLGQNSASSPAGIIDPCAVTSFLARLNAGSQAKPCPDDKPYPGNIGTNDTQKAAVRRGPCWSCGAAAGGRRESDPDYFTPDHQPPQKAAWNLGGCHEPEKFDVWRRSTESVSPQCKGCSNSQGGTMGHADHDSALGWLSLAWP